MPGQFFLAAAAFIEKDEKILILKRSSKLDFEKEFWETVSGRLEQNLTEVKNELLREIKEELGGDFKCQVIAPFGTYNFYRGENKTQETVGIDYFCKYISGEIELSKEHTEYRWIDPKEFEKYQASESLKSKVKLFSKIRNWYLKNSDLFRGYK
jgi:8-oxo-dGTP diphosphatase